MPASVVTLTVPVLSFILFSMNNEIPSFKIDRYKKIISLVNSNKSISLLEIEKTLNASRITIQRDLVDLENRKLLRRFHGGAMSLEYSQDLYDHDLKKSVNVAAKKKIAAKAASFITEGSYIGLDASSTVYYLSETIFPGNVLVFTCCIDSFKNLSARDDIQLVLAGGRMNKKTNTLTGTETIDFIKKFHFDTVFISAESCIPEKGFFDPHEEEVQIKRAFIESSNKTIMLLDSTKIAEIKGIKICDFDEIDYVVTDNPEKTGLKKLFKDKVL
jgi:DeoR/GlpR family transcriptional regulator of sugar metabolism